MVVVEVLMVEVMLNLQYADTSMINTFLLKVIRIYVDIGFRQTVNVLLLRKRFWKLCRCGSASNVCAPMLGGNPVAISGPYNDGNADFLIHGVEKPLSTSESGATASAESVQSNVTADTTCLSVEMLNQILQQHTPTIVSIHPSCRLNFSRTLKSALDNVIAKPRDLSVWLQLLLLSVCTLNLYVPKCSVEERSGTRKKLQISAINQSFTKWGEPQGCAFLTQKLLNLSNDNNCRKLPKKKKMTVNTNMPACLKKLRTGQFTAAIRVLSSDGISLPTPDTMYELQQKHPHAPPPSIPADDITTPSLSVDVKAVLVAIKIFPKGIACEHDGLRAQHLLDALSGPAAAVVDELLEFMVGVINLWLAGNCPSELGEYMSSAPLTPLLKPGGGVRPIAVGTIWRRLCSKLAANAVCKDIIAYLGSHQFGVGIPCGGEGIMHAANRLLELKGTHCTQTMLLVDFTNAFNLVDRATLIHEVRNHCPSISRWVEFCYSTPARLYYNQHILSSALGVQQGDPLGPLLFSLALHPLVVKIAA
ncbi:uncharacterized protein LOC113287662 [Papaver somniferum]|uniref:uncharacterized protein LOC113287662 n=1 Tax=Papaver somniferum TaxID=3469 RepID=UPI000E6FE447|nr:uncharacterized protein LOC113287662 [Papaver somniferum]